MPKHLLGGRVRLSTVLIALVFVVTLAAYLLVRPVPVAGTDPAPAPPSPTGQPAKTPAQTPTGVGSTPATKPGTTPTGSPPTPSAPITTSPPPIESSRP